MTELSRKRFLDWLKGARTSEIEGRLSQWEWEYVAAADIAADDADYERRRVALDGRKVEMEKELVRRIERLVGPTRGGWDEV